MKLWHKILMAVGLVIVIAVGFTVYNADAGERAVGFQTALATDAKGNQFPIAIWYPTEAQQLPTTFLGLNLMKVARDGPIAGTRLPLVVISHGNGAGMTAHVDLALALASNGYIVAAPMHSGDNFQDQSGVGTANFFHLRAQQLRATIDHVANRWTGRGQVDRQRIGAFGMSMGGFTVLTAVGATPDLGRIATHCGKAREFACDVLRHFKSPYLLAQPQPVEPIVPDDRIKAAVLAAPGFGFTLTEAGLDNVRVPIQLWTAELDDKVPDAGPVRHLGPRVDHQRVAGAGHLSFLAPCRGLLRPAALCSDAPGFDRAAFHTVMNASVVRFFDRHLKPAGQKSVNPASAL